MITLLDVNALIALVDPLHEDHSAAVTFFPTAIRGGWSTCPLTENGFLRIVGGKSYPNGPGSPQAARQLLSSYLNAPGHEFWPDALSLTDTRLFVSLPSSPHLTAVYLLALAVQHRAQFATFDQGVDPSAVPGGTAALVLIPRS